MWKRAPIHSAKMMPPDRSIAHTSGAREVGEDQALGSLEPPAGAP
jgi:hypothetical protein